MRVAYMLLDEFELTSDCFGHDILKDTKPVLNKRKVREQKRLRGRRVD